MKKILNLSFIIIFICSSPLLASNYYWVGGTGAWSDYAAHWATSSGGTVFHVTIPSPSDDVFFDASSFAVTGDTVYMDTTITNCHNMDWSAVTNAPVFDGSLNLQLYGSCILSQNIIWKVAGQFTFKSASPGNIIDAGGLQLFNIGLSFHIVFDGTGSWQLLDSLSVGPGVSGGSINMNMGSLKTNGYAITCKDFKARSSNHCTLLLDNSIITCNYWDFDYQTPFTLLLDADSAIINTSLFFTGKGFIFNNVTSGSIYADSCTFNEVSCNSVNGDANNFKLVTMSTMQGNSVIGDGSTFNKLIMPANACSFNGSNLFDTLIFSNSGPTIFISDGSVLSVNDLQGPGGTCGGLSNVSSTGNATISKSSGTVTFNYLRLQNISANGGATFIANNSIDAGNVSGITINSPAPQNLFWVGGTGNWNDVSHWAISSGGAGGSCVPNQFDDVFFDANSFLSANDTVYTSIGTIYCHNMNWNSVTNAPVFFGSLSLQIYGSCNLSPNMIWNVNGDFTFKSASPGNIIDAGGLQLFNNGLWFHIVFDGAGSWQLLDSLSVGTGAYGGSINLYKGSLKTNGYAITCNNFNATYSNPCTLLLDNSIVTCQWWNFNYQTHFTLFLDADSAIIHTSLFDGGTGFTYNNVICGSLTTDTCSFNEVSCNSANGTANTYHLVNMQTQSGNSVNGNGSTFNKLIMPANACSFNGSNLFDTLIFSNFGPTIFISDGSVLSVNDLQGPGGTCGGLSSVSSTGNATISKSSGTVTFNYLRLQNISANGGATFIANNSIDAGNVSGITINSPAPQNLYWVGGTGNWNDVNHWAISSGGAGGSCVPNQFDDVFFDANSFLSANDTVYTSIGTIYCHNMNWNGVTNAPVFFGSLSLQIYGSCILSPNMIWNVNGDFTFKSASPGNIIDAGGLQLFKIGVTFHIVFDGTGSWQLLDSLSVGPGVSGGSINMYKGSLKTNGYAITCKDFKARSSNHCTLLLDNSIITCNYWDFDYQTPFTLLLDADSAIINTSLFSTGKGFIFNNVTSGSIYADSCTFNEVSCNSVYGDANNFKLVTMSSQFGSTVNGNGSTFNKMIMPASSCYFNGSNLFDTLIFNNPGQTISFNNSNIITVTDLLILQSDPGFPTSIICNSGIATISKPADTLCTDFIYLKNIAATGGAVYFAGDHSVDLGGNTGWNWTRCAPLISNVWPGDCNYDLVTDNFDLLNIGVSFGDTGYVRPAASLSYTAQPCQDWYYQFINAANVKHADCDGNGIVDANDSTAISLNYGLTHPARLMHQDENNSIGTELAFVLPPVIIPGAAVSVPVTLGTNIYPATNIYGIAFTVNYDPAFIQPGTMSVDYTSSWVENAGNHLHLEKDFPGSGKTDIAFTRIDHSDASGYGMIATLNFIASPTANGPFSLSFSHVRVISHNEIEIPIQTGTSTTWVNIEETGNHIASTVFPNPLTKDAQVIFSNLNHETWYFSMQDVTGRIVLAEKSITANSVLIEKKNLGSGVYFYHLRNAEGKTGIGKIVIE